MRPTWYTAAPTKSEAVQPKAPMRRIQAVQHPIQAIHQPMPLPCLNRLFMNGSSAVPDCYRGRLFFALHNGLSLISLLASVSSQAIEENQWLLGSALPKRLNTTIPILRITAIEPQNASPLLNGISKACLPTDGLDQKKRHSLASFTRNPPKEKPKEALKNFLFCTAFEAF